MIEKLKQISWLVVSMLAVLVLFAGCGDDKDDGGGVSSATLAAETVNCFTTTNKIVTHGSPRLAYEARIVSQGDEVWCSFDLLTAAPQLTITGNVGEPIYLYLKQNLGDADRTALIDVDFSNGYTTRLTLTQTAYSPTAGFDRAWGEQPAFRISADYIYKTYHTTLYNGKYVRNYSICYDLSKHVSHWVAYPIYKDYTSPSVSRTDAWGYDPNTELPVIPDADQQYIYSGYGVRGYDRGHMLPSASRYSNKATNAMTFYATNMMPQNSTLNQNIWGNLEGKVRGWGGKNKYDTLYVVTGTAFKKSTTISNSNGPIAVPSHCWKVLLRQRGNENRQISDFKADELKAIGFIFTNDASGAATSLRDAACTVEEVEELTGFEFFRNLDPTVAADVKSQKEVSAWSGL